MQPVSHGSLHADEGCMACASHAPRHAPHDMAGPDEEVQQVSAFTCLPVCSMQQTSMQVPAQKHLPLLSVPEIV